MYMGKLNHLWSDDQVFLSRSGDNRLLVYIELLLKLQLQQHEADASGLLEVPAPFWPLVAPNGPHTWSRRPSICMCGALVASCLWGDRGNHCWALASSPQSTSTHQSPWILTQTPSRCLQGPHCFVLYPFLDTSVCILDVSHFIACIQRLDNTPPGVFISLSPLLFFSLPLTLFWQVTLDPNDQLMIKTGC